jgi:hypothetical protein
MTMAWSMGTPGQPATTDGNDQAIDPPTFLAAAEPSAAASLSATQQAVARS